MKEKRRIIFERGLGTDQVARSISVNPQREQNLREMLTLLSSPEYTWDIVRLTDTAMESGGWEQKLMPPMGRKGLEADGITSIVR